MKGEGSHTFCYFIFHTSFNNVEGVWFTKPSVKASSYWTDSYTAHAHHAGMYREVNKCLKYHVSQDRLCPYYTPS